MPLIPSKVIMSGGNPSFRYRIYIDPALIKYTKTFSNAALIEGLQRQAADRGTDQWSSWIVSELQNRFPPDSIYTGGLRDAIGRRTVFMGPRGADGQTRVDSVGIYGRPGQRMADTPEARDPRQYANAIEFGVPAGRFRGFSPEARERIFNWASARGLEFAQGGAQSRSFTRFLRSLKERGILARPFFFPFINSGEPVRYARDIVIPELYRWVRERFWELVEGRR